MICLLNVQLYGLVQDEMYLMQIKRIKIRTRTQPKMDVLFKNPIEDCALMLKKLCFCCEFSHYEVIQEHNVAKLIFFFNLVD